MRELRHEHIIPGSDAVGLPRSSFHYNFEHQYEHYESHFVGVTVLAIPLKPIKYSLPLCRYGTEVELFYHNLCKCTCSCLILYYQKFPVSQLFRSNIMHQLILVACMAPRFACISGMGMDNALA